MSSPFGKTLEEAQAEFASLLTSMNAGSSETAATNDKMPRPATCGRASRGPSIPVVAVFPTKTVLPVIAE